VLDFNWRTAFIHMVIVARKPQSESDIGRDKKF
jgi:hypothetical protein